jgi:hypothetical protein
MNEFRAVVIPDNPWRKILVSLVFMVICFLIAISLLSIQTKEAIAGKENCPDGHTCYWALHNNSGRRQCFPNTANLGNGWTWTTELCGAGSPFEPSKTPFQSEPTKTHILPSPTRRSADADPTDVLTNNPTATPTIDPGNHRPTVTPTLIMPGTLFESSQICDLCQMLGPLETMAAAQATQAAYITRP